MTTKKLEFPEKTVRHVFESMTREQKNAAYWLVGEALDYRNRHRKGSTKSFWKSISTYQPFCEGAFLDIYEAMTKEQKIVVSFLVDKALS